MAGKEEKTTDLDALLRRLEEAEREFDEKMKNSGLEDLLSAADKNN